jgi:hypothetical protein
MILCVEDTYIQTITVIFSWYFPRGAKEVRHRHSIVHHFIPRPPERTSKEGHGAVCSFHCLWTFFFLIWSEVFIHRVCFFKLFLFIYSHVHTVLFGSFLPPDPYPPISPSLLFPPPFQAEPVLPLSLILLKRKHKHNKEDKVFLLVKDSYTEGFLALLSCTNMLQPMLIHL